MSKIKYHELEGTIGLDLLHTIGDITRQIFPSPGQIEPDVSSRAEFLNTNVNGHQWVHLCLAYDGNALVGFKIGRSNDPRTFESWNGGVIPKARKQGIASELARRQEDWCRNQGFKFLTTETAYNNQAMLILNLKRGFNITGTYLDRGTNLKVILQKPLVSGSD